MAKVTVNKTGCEVGRLFQWDRGQVLEVYGLSMAAPPALHFSHDTLENAIEQSTTMDSAGVIRATVPDALLEKGEDINVYVCTDTGGTFRTHHTIRVQVEKRPQPCDNSNISEEEIVNG